MGSSLRQVSGALVLVACGVAAALAWQHRLWGTLAGAAVIAGWLAATGARLPVLPAAGGPDADRVEAAGLLALLDQVPTPLVRVAEAEAWALNRAARALFATDGLVRPVPPALLDPAATRVRHGGRGWRIDRVASPAAAPALLALVDVDAAERAAQLQAGDEMVEVLGHELLNGLAPIVSLAESAALAAELGDPALGPVLDTLRRRAEGLRRFAEAYRALARLPAPNLAVVALDELVDDLCRLFAGRFPGIALATDMPAGLRVRLDRDQLVQASWALLQNAAEAAATARPSEVGLIVRQVEGGMRLDVSDNGAGIAAPERGRIFQPFHTTKPEGSGIGLSLARRIARGHGGDVMLLPVAPTTFRLWLPDGAASPVPAAGDQGAAVLSRGTSS